MRPDLRRGSVSSGFAGMLGVGSVLLAGCSSAPATPGERAQAVLEACTSKSDETLVLVRNGSNVTVAASKTTEPSADRRTALAECLIDATGFTGSVSDLHTTTGWEGWTYTEGEDATSYTATFTATTTK